MKTSLRRTLSALLAASALAAPDAFAWGQLGHRLVGDLAQSRLTPAARKQVDALLQGESEPSLGGVASWADALRQSDPPRFKATSPWHYIDVGSDDCVVDLPRDCPDGNCVVGAIEAQRKILADKSQPLEARRDALKFLVHFVGDAHQPLHAGNRDDAGGNKYQISLTTDIKPEAYAAKNYVDGVMGTNLHSVWDYYILASAGLSPARYADKLRAEGIAKLTPSTLGTPAQWASESCAALDVRQAYPLTASGKEQHKLDNAYLDAQRPYAEAQVRLAAARLAELLNETLK